MSDVTFTPVVGDPFAQSGTPVDHNPFLPSPSASDMLQSYTPSWSERIGNAIQDTLAGWGMSRGNAQDYGESARTAAGLVPGLGSALAGNQAVRDYQSGDYLGAGLNALASVPIPGAGLAEGAIAKAGGSLAMDEAARLSRAREMGFRTNMPLYHGTNVSFEAFDPTIAAAKTNNPAAQSAIFAAGDPETAGEFVGTMSAGSSPQMMKLYHRAAKPASIALDGSETNEEIAATLQNAWGNGYDAVRLTNYTTPSGAKNRTIFAIKDPSQLRVPAAAFDPSQRLSPNLLAGIAGVGIAGSGAAAYQLTPVNGDPFVKSPGT